MSYHIYIVRTQSNYVKHFSVGDKEKLNLIDICYYEFKLILHCKLMNRDN